MTVGSFAPGTRTAGALLATASAIAMLPLAAKAQTVANVDVSVGAMAASNPYLRPGPDTESGAINVTFHPYITSSDSDTDAKLEGTLTLENFFDHYGTGESAQLSGSIEHRFDERTTFSAGVGFQTSESAARYFYGGANLDDLEPGEFPDGPVIDPTLGNISGRTSRLDVNVALRQLVSTNGVLDINAGLGLTRVESSNGADYRETSSAIAYSHQLNERTSLLGTVSVGYADYFNRRAGDGLFITTLAGVEHKFTESMYGSAQVGVSYATVETLLTGNEDVTNWAATVDLCDTLARGTLCATGSRSAQPTSLGGVTMVTAVGVSYSRAVGPAGNISLSGNYSKSGTSDSSPILLGRRETEIVNVGGSYNHRIGERLSAFVSPSFTSNKDQFVEKEENYQVLVGISYLFGRTR